MTIVNNFDWFIQMYEDFEEDLILSDEIFYQTETKTFYKPDMIYYLHNDTKDFCIRKILEIYLDLIME